RVAPKEIPGKGDAVAEISPGVIEDRVAPGRDELGRTEEPLLVKALHDETAGNAPPVEIPFRRTVAVPGDHRGLLGRPRSGKAIGGGKVADAAEIEDHDRLDGMLPLGAEHALIDELDH